LYAPFESIGVWTTTWYEGFIIKAGKVLQSVNTIPHGKEPLYNSKVKKSTGDYKSDG